MARIKRPPKVPRVWTAQVTGNPESSKDYQNIQFAPSNVKSTTNLVLPTMDTYAPDSPKFDAKPAEEEHRNAPRYSVCPTCSAEFTNMPVQDIREHVESCSPSNNDAESETSELSEPPADLTEDLPHNYSSVYDVNENDEDNDDDSSDDYPEPYKSEKFTLYPELKASEASEDENADSTRIPQLTITDPSKFAASLEDMENLSYEDLYHRITNAQQALVAWQDEWIMHEDFTYRNQPLPPMTDAAEAKWRDKNPWPKNPRIGKEFPRDDEGRKQYAAKYQARLEALVYGYEYIATKGAEGQDPVNQRIAGSRDGRELRQRVPTQKSADGENDEDADTDDENSKRRGRGQRTGYDSVGFEHDSGRGARIRFPSSRVDSSRDQTPVKTFASGKKIGRPRKNPIQVQQSQAQEQAKAARRRERETLYGLTTNGKYSDGTGVGGDEYSDEEETNVPLETSEHWNQSLNTSRPTTSSSMDSSYATGQDQSGKGKRRQNTSDFEDALPSNKRIKANGINGTESAAAQVAREVSHEVPVPGKSSRSDKMRTIQRESWAKDDGSRKEKLKSGMKARWADAKAKGQKSLGPAPAKKDEPAKAKKGPKVKQEGEISAASRNMLNRWAKKREALAAGLPVPNIGRYAKEKSATSNTRATSHTRAPSTTQTPEQSNVVNVNSSTKIGSGTKELPKTSSAVEAWRGQVEIPSIEGPGDGSAGKKRNVRPKKDIKADIQASEHDTFQNRKAEFGISGDDYVSKKAGKQPQQDNTVALQDEQLSQPATSSRPRRKKATEGITSSATTSNTTSSAQIQGFSEPAPVRTSGRIRKPSSRQASAVASSQSSTRPSSRSQNTVTPTPGPVLLPEDTENKPRSHIIKLKTRGAAAILEIPPSPAVDVRDMTKRKRIGKVVSSHEVETTAVTEDGEEDLEEGLEGEPSAKRRRGGRVKKENAADDLYIILPDDVEEVPSKRRRGGQSMDVAGGFGTEEGKSSKEKDKFSASKKIIGDKDDVIEAGEASVPQLGPEELAAARAVEAAKQAKSEKMREIMKRRWARGDMASVMEKKKANNRARKAAVLAASTGIPIPVATILPIASFDDSPPSQKQNISPATLAAFKQPLVAFSSPDQDINSAPKKARKPTGAAAHKRNQKPPPIDLTLASPATLADSARKMSEYEEYQQIASATSSPTGGRRARRPAALKAQRSLSRLEDDDAEDVEEDGDAVEQQLATQMNEYDQYQALASPVPGVVLGKRKRKPVMNLEEAMRIEHGDEYQDDFEDYE